MYLFFNNDTYSIIRVNVGGDQLISNKNKL